MMTMTYKLRSLQLHCIHAASLLMSSHHHHHHHYHYHLADLT